ncbi:MAG: AzlD domain-containing protein [Clostridiales bacterium]|nr:AzlD domain-containing protein [Clostridiales bacterium]
MEWSIFIPYLVVMAVVTYLIRMLPLAAIRGRVNSVFLQSFLYYVPYAVLGAMTFPAVLQSTGNWTTAAAGTVVALVLGWKNKGLLTVAAAACAAAYLVGLVVI